MSWDVSTETRPTARKDYHCDASHWIEQAWPHEDFEPEEQMQIEKAQAEGWKILAGNKYVKVTGIFEGVFTTFRGRPELCDICTKYDLYDY